MDFTGIKLDNTNFILKIRVMSEVMNYLKNAVSHPLRTASLLPSSDRLSNMIVNTAEVLRADVIVEFGSGTGAITEKIIEKMSPSARLVAMEINPDFSEQTKKRFPQAVVFNKCAGETLDCLESLGIDGCDRIVSGLPWVVFGSSFQKKLLSAAREALNPGGVFVSFAYAPMHVLPGGKNFRNNLEAMFSKVEKTKIEWRNLPPAFVYRAQK